MLAVAALFALFGLVLIFDLVRAVGAESCLVGGPDCYPWGTEGPGAGDWRYASKANYLLSRFAQLGLIFGSFLLLGWRALQDRSLATLERAFVVVALIAVTMFFLL